MNASTRRELLAGPAGAIEVAIDGSASEARGLAVVAHPHPLFGGTLDNKVVQTLARALVQSGFLVVRPNFRGVGQSEGVYDNGHGETDDLVFVIDALRLRLQGPARDVLVLAGFSFGSFVQTRVARRLHDAGRALLRMVLVGVATSRFEALPVPEGTIVIHGENDDTVPLSSVLDWARPQELPVIVIPGADHFFHRRLPTIKRLVLEAMHLAEPVDKSPLEESL